MSLDRYPATIYFTHMTHDQLTLRVGVGSIMEYLMVGNISMVASYTDYGRVEIVDVRHSGSLTIPDVEKVVISRRIRDILTSTVQVIGLIGNNISPSSTQDLSYKMKVLIDPAMFYLEPAMFNSDFNEECRSILIGIIDIRNKLYSLDRDVIKSLTEKIRLEKIEQWLSCKQVPGYIYLVKGLYETPTYKIGYSKTPKKRIRKFDVVLPFPIETTHLIKTDHMKAVEAYLHDKYKDRRSNGEWFELTPDDVAEICAIETLNAEDIA